MLAVMNTSFTTGMAFVATSISPIMPIKSMGIYAFLLVILNYVLVITLTPTVFATWHIYRISRFECSRPSWCRCSPDADEVEKFTGTDDKVDVEVQARRKASCFITRVFVPIFRHRIAAIISILILVAWGVTNCYLAAQLESPVEAFTFFGKQHMTERAKKMSNDGYVAGSDSQYNTLTIAFGITGVDRDADPGVDQWKPHKFYGVPLFDPSFDISSNASQQYMREFCQRLRSASCPEKGCQPVGKLVLQSTSSVSCFIEDFDLWTGPARYEGAAFKNKLVQFRNATTPRFTVGSINSWEEPIGLIGSQLRYVMVHAKISLKVWKGDTIKEPVLNRIETFLDQERALAPAGLKSIKQTVPFDWVWLSTNQGLIRGMFLGFAIGFPVAFLVVLIATQNLIIACMAVLTVSFVVANVLGYCYMAGWKLGPGECIAGIIVIGLAVDYTVHLGHAYLDAAHHGLETREQRWEFALNTMGVTVIAGAVTTFFAAIVMQLCQITFFIQMSTLIVLTIVYSIVYTLCCFMAMLGIVGPQFKVGDLPTLYRKVRDVLSPSDDVKGTPQAST